MVIGEVEEFCRWWYKSGYRHEGLCCFDLCVCVSYTHGPESLKPRSTFLQVLLDAPEILKQL